MAKTNEVVLKQIKRVLEIFKNSESELRPHFLLSGPSGCGKSFNIAKLVKDLDLHFIEVNAAQLTKEGLAGNSLSKALAPLKYIEDKLVVCFVDEFDKLFISGNHNECANDSTIGVQNEFLKVLEADTTSVFGDYGKYIPINVSNVLFIFAGAFNGAEMSLDKLRDFGVKTEFLGRVGLLYNMEKSTVAEYIEALKNSKQFALYSELFPMSTKKKAEAIDAISKEIRAAYDTNTLGFRLVNTLINQYFISGGFPEKTPNKSVFHKKMQLEHDEEPVCESVQNKH